VKARDTRLVVCAAIINNAGVMICGPRHGDCLNAAIKYGIDPLPDSEHWECGFVDQDNKFMSRAEAWAVADQAGQIRRPTGFEKNYVNQRTASVGDKGLLFSENLY
jgi:hypothetical protein